ncbi:RNA polymerase sigma factor (sigma-70 family) [Dysgonomonas hofstadii]|uniref:RNA polymerase sigma factor (Sigma-70 family) n=1 Tax=Dysgonomonas hofstadii TaxID=637886 RepID=A0A840CJG8_9BACT|nr:RNA polymerase sigma factor [Dysgonomonas hofstadii]MBB4034158.1 RNA polymerase sigma factor (sigma-70 family) [Dysgonomonas hofstadii]
MDKDIIKVWDLFRDGDEDSFSLLFETFFDTLFRYGMKFVSDENLVKDCIQDLFIKLHNNRASLSSTTNPKFYLLFSLKNMILDAIAKNKRLTYVSPQDLPFIATYQYLSEQEETEETEEVKQKFEQVLNMLNSRQKEAIYLRFQLDLSYEEISELLGINYQSARNLIHRSITKIRDNMDLALFISLFIRVFN